MQDTELFAALATLLDDQSPALRTKAFAFERLLPGRQRPETRHHGSRVEDLECGSGGEIMGVTTQAQGPSLRDGAGARVAVGG